MAKNTVKSIKTAVSLNSFGAEEDRPTVSNSSSLTIPMSLFNHHFPRNCAHVFSKARNVTGVPWAARLIERIGRCSPQPFAAVVCCHEVRAGEELCISYGYDEESLQRQWGIRSNGTR
eukprot:GHVU01022358.1.p1 GENE.GHVU01022358.1~~GHVU01022358.1.p1  ORF type:complete len:118 (-),score=9.56 GHVU01022358.1:180-533(-)